MVQDVVTNIGRDLGFLGGCLWVLESKSSLAYNKEMTSREFEEQFQKIVTVIEPKCVIVMENASHHSFKVEKIASSSTRQSEMTTLNRVDKIPKMND